MPTIDDYVYLFDKIVNDFDRWNLFTIFNQLPKMLNALIGHALANIEFES